MKILIVDDHLLFLEGLPLILKNLPFDAEILSASSIEDAQVLMEEHGSEIGLALIDLNLPAKGGVLFARTLTSKKYLIPTIIVSAEEDLNRIKKGISSGAQGFIPKSSSGEVMISAILQVLDGEQYFPTSLTEAMVIRSEHDKPYNEIMGDSEFVKNRIKFGVSKRQYETLLLMAKGLSNKEIAENLFLSEHTVKSHVSVLFQLLDVTNRTECVLRAKEINLIG